MSEVLRSEMLTSVDVCVEAGASQAAACAIACISPRTLQRWRLLPTLEDRRHGPDTVSGHALTKEEQEKIVEVAASTEFRDKSPHQIVPILADRGEWVASESSFYRVLKLSEMLTHRDKSRPKSVHRPKALEATEPNQVFSWDITYLLSTLRGQYFYLYMFLDIFSRKVVGWRVHERESMDLSSLLLTEICENERIDKNRLSVHSDNGGAMKGATMLVTMQKLGIMPSFSRPSVSNDNPFSESLFKTLKYCPQYPSKPFESIEQANQWVAQFVEWYNGQHLHSGIKFVTPNARHEGADVAILENRTRVYKQAKLNNPQRWSKEVRNWDRIHTVKLNFLKGESNSDTTATCRLAS
jgi:putative transposase